MEPAPYRTVCSPLAMKFPPSAATLVQVDNEPVDDPGRSTCTGKVAGPGASAISIGPVGSDPPAVALVDGFAILGGRPQQVAVQGTLRGAPNLTAPRPADGSARGVPDARSATTAASAATAAATAAAATTAAATAAATAASAGTPALAAPPLAATALPGALATARPLPRPAIVTDPLQILQSTTRDEKQAWRELAPAWQLALGDADPCPAAQRQQVPCFKIASSTLALIRQLDRPGILTLRSGNVDAAPSPAGFAVLTGLTEGTATLRMNGASQTVSLAVLATLWQGDFATLWRAPDGYTALLAPGSAGPVVDRLAAQLAALDGSAPPAAGQGFDAALKARVHAFQLAQGLKPDGRAGPTTFMQLNRARGAAEPRLSTPAAAP